MIPFRKRKRDPPLMSLKQQIQDAEERSWALLRALVDPKDWNGDLMSPLRVTAASGWTYEIYVHSGTVENIVRTDRNGYKRRLCAAPFPWNDYVNPDTQRGIRNGRVNVDQQLFDEARMKYRAEGLGNPPGIPKGDLFLGQYLALKYDEKTFLERAIF
jgi:hypothetical protein